MAWIERRRGIYYVCWREGARGSQKRKIRVGPRKAEALKVKTLIESEVLAARLGRGGLIAPQRRTLTDFYAGWRSSRLPRLRPKTAAVEGVMWRCHIEPAFGGSLVSGITTEQVERWLAGVAARVSVASALRAYIVLRKMLADAQRYGVLAFNPAANVQKPRRPAARPRALSVEELCRLLTWAPQDHRALILTAALTGLRWGELVALEWRDVDFAGHKITVERAVPSGTRVVALPKTAASIREVDLLPPAERALMDLPQRALVFPGRRGGYLNHRHFCRSVWGPALQGAGLQGVTFHALRHTYASLLIGWGEQILYVARQLGHARPSITVDTYAHLLRGSLRGQMDRQEALARIENVYRGAPPVPHGATTLEVPNG